VLIADYRLKAVYSYSYTTSQDKLLTSVTFKNFSVMFISSSTVEMCLIYYIKLIYLL